MRVNSRDLTLLNQELDRVFLQDLRYGVRTLLANKGVSATAVLTLALGIGANSAVFSVVRDFLLRPLPFAAPERLVAVTSFEDRKTEPGWVSNPDFRDWRNQTHVFQDLAAYSERSYNVTGGAEPERVAGMGVTADFFPLLGIKPMLGRQFSPQEDRPGGPPVVVISHALWQRRFGGSTSLSGQAIVVDGTPLTIVGVMPAGFRFSNTSEDVWIPLRLNPASQYRGSTYLKVLGRLQPGMSIEHAQREMTLLVDRIGREHPDTSAGRRVRVEGLHDHLVKSVRPAVIVVLSIVAVVLLVSCTNVANVLLARAVARQKEVAIRRAMGADAGRIVRQLLTESALLGLAGGSLGFLLALWGVEFIYARIPPSLLPLRVSGVDAPIFAFTLGLSMLTSVAFGIVPAWFASRSDINGLLKSSSRSFRDVANTRARGVLVITEVALAVVLLVCAGVLVKSFVRLTNVNPGFRAENVLTLELTHAQKVGRFYREAIDGVSRLPGVIAAGATSKLPMTGPDWGQNITPEGRQQAARHDEDIFADTRAVTPGYFAAIGIPLRRGRVLTDRDWDASDRVCVINETMAKEVWGKQDPIGKRFKIGDYRSPDTRPWVTVVGVVADTKRSGLTTAAVPEMYFADANPRMAIVLRTAGDPASYIGAAREVIRSLDRNQPISKVQVLERIVADSIAPQRITMCLAALFAAVALLLTGIGLYGVIAHSVAQRTHEIGIRMAVGADHKHVARLVVRQAMTLVLAGLAVGASAALLVTRTVSRLLFEVSPRDPVTLTAVVITVMAVALAASYIPARRAAMIDPVSALAQE